MDEVTTTEDVTIDVEEAAGVGDMEIETEEIGGGTTINKSSGQTLFICSVMGGSCTCLFMLPSTSAIMIISIVHSCFDPRNFARRGKYFGLQLSKVGAEAPLTYLILSTN